MNDELAKRLKQNVATFYETQGAAFDRTRGFVWPEEQSIAERIKPGMTVADIGAGNGRFARLLPDGAIYIGIEPSDSLRSGFPRKAKTVAAAFRILSGALPHLPLDDQTADVTVCFAVFHHLPTVEDRRAAVDELVRVTKPGGMIAATAWYLNIDNPRLSPVHGGDAGDFWMSWKAEGADTKRYVHVFDEKEWLALWTDPRLAIEHIGLFGREGWTKDEQAARNRMAVCRRV